MKKYSVLLMAVLLFACAESSKNGVTHLNASQVEAEILNAECPVSHEENDPADREVVEYNGEKIALCCKKCVAKFSDAPHKYVAALDAKREEQKKVVVSPAFKAQLTHLMQPYFTLQASLVNEGEVNEHIGAFKTALAEVSTHGLSEKALVSWKDLEHQFRSDIDLFVAAEDILSQRKAFVSLSETAKDVVKYFGVQEPVYIMYCPMAFNNKGAEWLQNTAQLQNPYESRMKRCGRTTETIEVSIVEEDHSNHQH